MLCSWRAQVFVLYFATRLPAFHMSSASLPGNRKASDISCDSPEALNVKKMKLDQSDSSKKQLNDIPWTSVPSTAFHYKPITTPGKITLAPKLNFPTSAVKVSSTGSSNTESSGVNKEGQSCQVQDEDHSHEMESVPQETQNKSLTDEAQISIQVEAATTSANAQDACSSEGDTEAMDSGEEGDTQQTQKEDNSCDVWEQLPFFASEMGQSEEIDGGTSSALDKRSKVNKAATTDGEGERISKKKHGKKRNKKDEKEATPKKPPPNAFIAVRISSSDVNAKFKEVQGALLEKDERLKQVFVPAAKNHITLTVLRLNNPEEIEKAKVALLEATQKVTNELDLLKDPLVLSVSGLGNFSKNVLFAKIAEGSSRERLISMAGIVESVFATKELSPGSTNNFIPHLTIAKMSKKPRGKYFKKHHKKKKGKGDSDDTELHGIEHSAYAELWDTEFGSQHIEGLELLSMTKPPTEDGYYHCFQRHYFDSTSSTALTFSGENGDEPS